MFEQECERLVRCRDCGDLVSTEFGTCCELEAGRLLCFECAQRRGARFDSTRDGRWILAPSSLGSAAVTKGPGLAESRGPVTQRVES